jgi:hypothetical protein
MFQIWAGAAAIMLLILLVLWLAPDTLFPFGADRDP